MNQSGTPEYGHLTALPDDIPANWFGKDELSYHPSCWDEIIYEARVELSSMVMDKLV